MLQMQSQKQVAKKMFFGSTGCFKTHGNTKLTGCVDCWCWLPYGLKQLCSMLNQPNDCLPFCVSYPDWARAIFIPPLNVSLSLALARHVICNIDTEFEWSSGRWILVGINRSNIPSLCCVSGYLICTECTETPKAAFLPWLQALWRCLWPIWQLQWWGVPVGCTLWSQHTWPMW